MRILRVVQQLALGPLFIWKGLRPPVVTEKCVAAKQIRAESSRLLISLTPRFSEVQTAQQSLFNRFNGFRAKEAV